MYASYPHGLSIQQFAQYFRLDPWHVAGFCTCSDPDEYALTEGCRCGCGSGDFWTDDTLQDVSWAIAEAESDLADFLGFPPIQRWYTGIEVPIDGQPGWFQKGGRPRTVSTYKHIHEFGLQTLTYLTNGLVSVTLPIANNLATATLTATIGAGVDVSQVRFFVTAPDRYDMPMEQFQVIPQSAVLVGTTLTATFRAYQLGRPDVAHLAKDCLNRNDPDSYLESLDVYLEGFDSCNQGVAIGNPSGGCGGQPCIEVETPVCMTRGRVDGIYQYQALKSCVNGVFSLDGCNPIAPSRLELNFRAGYPLQNGRIDPLMVAAVCLLAASKLPCSLPSCDCTTCRYDAMDALRRVEVVKVDEGASGEVGNRYSILATTNQKDLAPWGVAKGALDAWRKVRRYQKI